MSALDVGIPVQLANYARGVSDAFTQNRPFMGEMKKRGTIEYDCTGASDGSSLNGGSFDLSGSIEAGRYKPRPSAPGKDVWDAYSTNRRFKRWTANWGKIFNGLRIDRDALRRNKGSIFNDLSKTEIPAMIRDTLENAPGLAWQILNMDANQYSGNDDVIYGLPTFMPGHSSTVSADGQTVSAVSMATAISQYDLEGFTPPSGSGNGTLTGSAPADTDKEVAIGGSPTLQNYLGLSMKAGALAGVDNAEWDAWTPALVNASFSGWTGNADDDDDAIEKVLSYLVFRCSRHSAGSGDMKPNMGILDRNYFEFLGAKKATRETVFISPDNKTKVNAETGYPVDKIFHQGIWWFWDEHSPIYNAFCLNSAQMNLKVQPLYRGLDGNSPLKTTGEDAGLLEVEVNPDPGRLAHLASCVFPGQLICKPRYFGRATRYSGTGV